MANVINDLNDCDRYKGFHQSTAFLIKVRRNIFTESLLAKFVDNMRPESNLFTVSAERGARSLRIHLRATLIGLTTLASCGNNSASHQHWKGSQNHVRARYRSRLELTLDNPSACLAWVG